MRIVAVELKDLVVLEEAVADLVCRLAEYEAESKSKLPAIQELTLHLDIVSGSSDAGEKFKLSFVGEGAKEKFQAIANSRSLEIPAGISKKDLGEFFMYRIAQLLFGHGWIWGRSRPDGFGFLASYRRFQTQK